MSNVTHLYIRHGERMSRNIDTPVTEEGLIKAKERAVKLLEFYGEPDYIVTSPYLRCRQTAAAINSYFDTPKQIYVDTRISSKSMALKRVSLSGDVTKVGSVSATTLIHSPPLNEPRGNVKNRIMDHRIEYQSKSMNIWFVTHRGCINDILEIYGCKGKYVKPLGAVGITNNSIELFDN